MTFVLVCMGWLFSVCVHEFAHAAVAYRGGDHTVKDKGYLSMNPIHYLDPVNSVLLPMLFLLLGGLGLPGAAVYIETHRLKNKHWESAVALAGPLANLGLLFGLAMVLQFDVVRDSAFAPGLAMLALLQATAVVLNLLPIPGFDGFGAIAPYLSYDLRVRAMGAGRMAMLVFLAAMFLVPGVARTLWTISATLTSLVDVPFGLAIQGWNEFRFWRR